MIIHDDDDNNDDDDDDDDRVLAEEDDRREQRRRYAAGHDVRAGVLAVLSGPVPDLPLRGLPSQRRQLLLAQRGQRRAVEPLLQPIHDILRTYVISLSLSLSLSVLSFTFGTGTCTCICMLYTAVVTTTIRLRPGPVRARGCKNGPAPFPGRMSYKATKPGLSLSVVS